MKVVLLSLSFFCFSMPCFAQQNQNDPEFLKHAIVALQTQRNNALDAQVVAESKLVQIQSQLDQANAKIKSLEDKQSKQPSKDK